MAANDLYELVQHQTLGAVHLVNRFILQDDGGGGSTPEDDIMAGHLANVIPAWSAAVSSAIQFTTLSCRRVYPTGGATFTLSVASSGDLAGEPLPPQSVAVIQFFTDLFTRAGRGRTHVSGIREQDVKDGLIVAAEVPLLVAILTSIAAGFGAWSYVIADPALGSFAQINQGNLQTHMYTLRSRKLAAT